MTSTLHTLAVEFDRAAAELARAREALTAEAERQRSAYRKSPERRRYDLRDIRRYFLVMPSKFREPDPRSVQYSTAPGGDTALERLPVLIHQAIENPEHNPLASHFTGWQDVPVLSPEQHEAALQEHFREAVARVLANFSVEGDRPDKRATVEHLRQYPGYASWTPPDVAAPAAPATTSMSTGAFPGGVGVYDREAI